MKLTTHIWENQEGHTLVESLVALVLVFIIIVPLTQFTGRLIFRSENLDKINAINLAEKEMEQCILNHDFVDHVSEEILENRKYEINRTVKYEGRLILLHVEIKKLPSRRMVARLYTMQNWTKGEIQ